MLTINNKITWKKKNPSIDFKNIQGSYVHSYYETNHNHKNFAIYTIIYKTYYDAVDEWLNNELIKLALLDDTKQTILWESSREVVAMEDLLSRVVDQNSNINEIIVNLG